MDAIKGILAEYYWIFLIVGILVLVTLIGFISSVKKKAKEQQPQVVEENTPDTQPVDQPEIPQPTGATLDLTPAQSQQPYVEPSLDGLASSATEVKLGFDTNEQTSSIFEDEGPMLVIEDFSASQAQPVVVQPQVVEQTVQPIDQGFGLAIEDPAAVQPAAPAVQPQPVAQPTPVVENEGPMLMIEDTSATQTAPVQPVAVEPQPVVEQPQAVEAVAQPAVVQQQVVTQPAPMVQPEPTVQQPVAQVAPAPQSVPVAQTAPVQQSVQTVPVQAVQPVAQPMPAQQPASISETDAPTLVIPGPSANQQQM